MATPTTTTATTTSTTASTAAFWDVPSAADAKEFIKTNRIAAIFWQFERNVYANIIQKQYNPIDVLLGYELTADEKKNVETLFKDKGWDVKFVQNPGDKSLNYVTKVSIYFADA